MSKTRNSNMRRTCFIVTCCLGVLAPIACLAAAPYLLRDLKPYESDESTALLLHLDGTLDDASAARLPGTATGVQWSDEGLMGRALLCDGKQGVLLPLQGELVHGLTVEAWVRLERPPVEQQETYHILQWGRTLDVSVEAHRCRLPHLCVTGETEKGRFNFRSFVPMCYRRWIHVAVIYDPSAAKGALLVLFNGTPAHYWRRYKGLPKVHGRLATSKERLRIGQGLRGLVDELRISTRPRSADELAARWPSGRIDDHEPFCPDVVARSQPLSWNPAALWLSAAEAVPTFNSIGLYVRYRGDMNTNGTCRVQFREQGATAWRRGMDLAPCREDGEHRGSLLMLKPDTTYEIELSAADPDGRENDGVYPAKPEELAPPLRLVKRTWREDVPIGEVRRLPAGESRGPLTITAQGRPDAWIMYAPPEGQPSTIAVAGTRADEAVRFDRAAYVVLQRVVVCGGVRQAIFVMDSHNIRIRRCEIRGYSEVGKRGKDGRFVDLEHDYPINMRAGVRVSIQSRQVVVEDNFIHSPLGTACSWKFGHPTGPQGVIMGYACSPNHVVRNNEIVGSEAHWWNDGIESCGNSFIDGGPYRDTDINGNVILCSQDDGTELDGGQINVRFWDNRVEYWRNGVSVCPNIKGPSYVFRNLFVNGGDEDRACERAFKMAALHRDYGRNYLLNNTRVSEHGSCWRGGEYTRAPYPHGQIFTATIRNNLHRVRAAYKWDYAAAKDNPALVAPGAGDYRLAARSSGIDAGVVVPNVTDGFAGRAPDLGAIEHADHEHGIIPHRPSGMIVRPKRVNLKHRQRDNTPPDEKPPADKAEVAITIPKRAGRHWRARPNCPWLRCTPDSGPTAEEPQMVTIDCIGDGLGPRLHRGAVVFRTDKGLNVSLLVDTTFYPNHTLPTMRAPE